MDNKKNETAEITSFNADIVEPAALVELNDADLAQVAGGSATQHDDDFKAPACSQLIVICSPNYMTA